MVHAKMVAIFEMTKQPNLLKDPPGKSTQRRIISHAHCFLTICEKPRSHHETQRNSANYRGEWRQVTMVAKFLDLNYCSWHWRSFALTNDRRKLWATVLFLSAIRQLKVIHVNFFVFYAILEGPGRFLLRSRKVATMAAWRNEFFSLLANVLKTFLVAECQVSAVLTY